MRVDVLITDQTPPRGRKLMQAVLDGARNLSIDAHLGLRQGGVGSVVMLYGMGGADRRMHAGKANVVSFDMGYWSRKGDDRHYRVSIGGYHCPELIFRGENPGPARWAKYGLPVAGRFDPFGPIMVVGHGPKSEAIGARGWAADKSREIRRTFPGRRILYRPKPKRPHEPGVTCDAVSHEAIEYALQKCSLVVCRHSNVAVDAARLGVPVVCDDGAAAAIYPSALTDWQSQPSAERRAEFLHRLAWWQWSVAECRNGAFWQWINGVLSDLR